jgi:toxin-antitoxin system PIN domain toxin
MRTPSASWTKKKRRVAGLVDLPDVNVWLAFSIADHAHHERARRYWEEEAGERLAFCRVTALGFLRLATNSSAMGGHPLTVPQAWQAYQDFRRLPEVLLADEPEACEDWLERWVQGERPSSRHWTDAYLAAFAQAGGLRVVSFDGDFTRFQGLALLRLEA